MHLKKILIILGAGAFCAVIAAAYYAGIMVYATGSSPEKKIGFLDNITNSLYLQQQAPRKSFSFLVIGDIQSGNRDFAQYVFIARDNGCSFMIQTGDLASHATTACYALVRYGIASAGLDMPLFIVPGNHDVRGNPLLFEKYFSSRQFFFFYSGCLFIVFDNAAGPPYDRQFDWLEQTLEENHRNARRVFVFMHREPVEWEQGAPHPALDDYARFFDLQQRFPLDCVFTGHVHSYRQCAIRGTTYISNGLECEMKGIELQAAQVTLVTVTPNAVTTKKIPVRLSLLHFWGGKLFGGMVTKVYPVIQNIFG